MVMMMTTKIETIRRHNCPAVVLDTLLPSVCRLGGCFRINSSETITTFHWLSKKLRLTSTTSVQMRQDDDDDCFGQKIIVYAAAAAAAAADR